MEDLWVLSMLGKLHTEKMYTLMNMEMEFIILVTEQHTVWIQTMQCHVKYAIYHKDHVWAHP